MLYSFSGVFLLVMLLFSFFAVNIIFSRITLNAKNLLDRSLIIAWLEYERFFNEEKQTLSVIANLRETRILFSEKESSYLAGSWCAEDFRFAIDRRGKIIASSFTNASAVPAQMTELTSRAWREGKITGTSEILMLNDYDGLFPPEMLKKIIVQTGKKKTALKYFPMRLFNSRRCRFLTKTKYFWVVWRAADSSITIR
jgi:hypothetical protein